ncbi:serine hydrolase domain-containing protein [Candidatus Latescibacterota bacterium]
MMKHIKMSASRGMFAVLSLVVIISVFSLCGERLYVYPGVEWERIADPESVGFSKEGLEAVRAHLDTLHSTGIVVVVDGRILFENGDIADRYYIASVRKSVLSMLYGNYVQDGTIDLKKTLDDLGMTDHGGLSDQEREATIADLLGARSGVYHPASNSGDNLADAPPRNSQKHGEYFLYNNWDFNALGFIFEQETGRDIYDALQTDLADRIGMQDYDRSAENKSGNLELSMYPAYHMHLSALDLARLGLLMLRRGKWNNEQVIPEDWAKKISSVVTPLEEMNPEGLRTDKCGYGYLWWIFDGPEATGPYKGAYTGRGWGGQYLTVLPELDMIVTHKNNVSETGGALPWDQYYSILEMILNARIEK